ncbi:MAG: MMPL family transporter [Chloroflexota bacterium]|nr:MAG: MMPL family transporter [Chloroflexota bacterium]
MTALTRWVLSHKLIVVGFWLIMTVVGFASASSATNALSQKFELPGKESFKANQTILRTYGTDPANPPFVSVITLPAGTTVSSPGIKAQLTRAFDRVAAHLPGSRSVSYASTGNQAFVSHDGRTTFGLIYPVEALGFNGPTLAQNQIKAALSGVTVAGQPIHLTGYDALASGGGGGSGPSVLVEALLGGLGALLILILVFRSFMAIVPLLMAIVAIPTTLLLVWGLTAVTDISFIVQFLVSLIGLGVAIDYSLLVVLRWREEHTAGVPNEAAVIKAMQTAGKSVIFSGTTVAIGLLALLVLPVPFLRSVGYGGALIPLVSVAVAVTLLPVILAGVGPKLDWPRVGGVQAGRWWTSWAQLVVRRRWFAALVGVVILGALVSSAATIVLGATNADALAKTGDAHSGLVALERSGIGVGPLSPFEILVADTGSANLVGKLSHVSGVQGVVAPNSPSWRRAGTAIVDVLPTVDSNTPAGHDVVNRVRQVAHAQLGGALVGGQAPGNFDFIDAVYGNFPLMIALIALITFLLLARAFRSLLLPLKAVVLNVLSVGAAFGVMVLMWQNGYGSQAIWGIKSTGAITSWVPIMVFAFLFGLSMDYEVFILARMREEYDTTGSTNSAVIGGIGRTGRLVTSGALILFFAFIALASGPETDIKVIGTGLAAGILLDATVVRMLLVPALVSLFGRWNWWMPHLPARLLRVEPSMVRVQASALDAAAE